MATYISTLSDTKVKPIYKYVNIHNNLSKSIITALFIERLYGVISKCWRVIHYCHQRHD